MRSLADYSRVIEAGIRGLPVKSILPIIWAAAAVFFPQDASAVCGKLRPPAPAVIRIAAVEEPLIASIDLSDQIMSVFVEGELRYSWPVSTGIKGFATPTGEWHAQWLSPDHHSSKYGWAPMPWSVFFYGGYAIHGTTEIDDLGERASHGCVRLHPDNAKIFFDLVVEYGLDQSLVRIVD